MLSLKCFQHSSTSHLSLEGETDFNIAVMAAFYRQAKWVSFIPLQASAEPKELH